MLVKTKESLSKIDHRLYAALLFMGLCPTLYTTLRTYFLGALPGDWAYSIAGQLSWINLIYEVMNEAVILPLYFFMASVLAIRKLLPTESEAVWWYRLGCTLLARFLWLFLSIRYCSSWQEFGSQRLSALRFCYY